MSEKRTPGRFEEALHVLAMASQMTCGWKEVEVVRAAHAAEVEEARASHFRAHPVCKQLYEDYASMKKEQDKARAAGVAEGMRLQAEACDQDSMFPCKTCHQIVKR